MRLTLGEKLKDLRTGKSLTTNQLCSEILKLYGYELSKGKYNEMERDVEKDYGYKAFVYLAKFYGVSVDYLLGLAKEPTTNKDLNFVCEYTGLSKETVETIKQRSVEWALGELLETELAEGGIISLILEYTTNAPTCPSGEELILSKNGDIRFVKGDVDVHDGFYFSDYNALHDCTVMNSLDIYNTFMLNLINDRLSILKNKTHKEIIEINEKAKAQMVFLKQREQELQAFFELHPNGGIIPIEETDLGKALQAKTEKEASNNAKHNPKKE
ncbi:MAG: hypothetical protein J6K17_11730 [Oscillospiraceae bacterium]|nr:hypothetical protein [Oscillospiraceae bacterium]